jgi:hypothetical protein
MDRGHCLSPKGALAENAGRNNTGQTDKKLHGGTPPQRLRDCGNHDLGKPYDWKLAHAKRKNPEICCNLLFNSHPVFETSSGR